MRRAFSNTLVRMAEENEKVIFLTADLGFQVFDDFIDKFGSRYVNVGIAEAQLINAAVGLALEGWRPIVYSIAPFVTARPYEQIRFGVAYHNLPVMIVGAGGGFTYSNAGPTHHAPDDLALMSALPGMTVVTPGGPRELSELMPQMLELLGPSYLRVGKFGEPDVSHESAIVLGKARRLLGGKRIAVLTAGDIISEIHPAVVELHKEPNGPALFHFHTIKPVDSETLDQIGNEFELMIIIEESISQGGLYHKICLWKAESNAPIRILRLGAPDSFILGNPDIKELRKRIGVDKAALIKTVHANT